MADEKLELSAGELEEFLKSKIWMIFDAIMVQRLEVIKSDLLRANSIEEVKRLQGEFEGIAFWHILPETMKTRYEIEGQMNSAKEKRNE